MLNYNIKFAIRNLLKNKVTSIIHLLGLGIGLGFTFIMVAIVFHDLSYDSIHKKGDRIYRVIYDNNCTNPYPLSSTLKTNYPEIEEVANFFAGNNYLVKLKELYVKEKNFYFADPSIFRILSFEFIRGNIENVMPTNNSIAISEKTAFHYFGSIDVIGKDLIVSKETELLHFTVSAIYKDFPSNTTIAPDFIAHSDASFEQIKKEWTFFGKQDTAIGFRTSWDYSNFNSYVLVYPRTNISEFNKKLQSFAIIYDAKHKEKKIVLQLLSKIYFSSTDYFNNGKTKTGDFGTIKIFVAIAFLILAIAMINYIILATALAGKRFKEIAIRILNGASIQNLRTALLFESILTSLFALPISAFVVQTFLPVIASLLQKDIVIDFRHQINYILIFVATTVFVGYLSGLYVSIALTRTKAVYLLTKNNSAKTQGINFRNILIIIQFAIFITLVSCTLIIQRQIQLSKNSHKQLATDNVIVINLNNDIIRQEAEIFKATLQNHPNVISAAAATFAPPTESAMRMTLPKTKDSDENINTEALFIEAKIVDMLQMKFVAGHNFPDNNSKQLLIVVNEAFVKAMNLDNPIGATIGFGQIVGVVKDFHIHPVFQPITPLSIMPPEPGNLYELLVKTNGMNNKQVIEFARSKYKEICPEGMFEFTYLNDRIADFYKQDNDYAKILNLFSVLAIFISALGLFGFTKNLMVNKTKEIGIHKINGAKSFQIVAMLNKDLLKWVLIAFVIASPIAWYAMHKWLENFAYKTELSWWIFVLAGLLAFVVALLTVSWQSWRAATRNPVESLRYE